MESNMWVLHLTGKWSKIERMNSEKGQFTMNIKNTLPICCALLALMLCFAGCVTVKDPEKTLPTEPQTTGTTDETGSAVHTTEGTTEGTTATTEESIPETAEEEASPVTTEPNEQDATTEPDEQEGTDSTTEPTGTTGTGSQPTVSPTLQEYNAMSAEEQYDFFMSFADPADFFAWQAKAKAEDEAMSGDIIIDGNTNVDLGDIAGGK